MKRVMLLLICCILLVQAPSYAAYNREGKNLGWWVQAETTFVFVSRWCYLRLYEDVTTGGGLVDSDKRDAFAYVDNWPYGFSINVIAPIKLEYYDGSSNVFNKPLSAFTGSEYVDPDWTYDHNHSSSDFTYYPSSTFKVEGVAVFLPSDTISGAKSIENLMYLNN